VTRGEPVELLTSVEVFNRTVDLFDVMRTYPPGTERVVAGRNAINDLDERHLRRLADVAVRRGSPAEVEAWVETLRLERMLWTDLDGRRP
jgi:hypothetical protein